jgi:hapalindole-type alkaloid chlorinase
MWDQLKRIFSPSKVVPEFSYRIDQFSVDEGDAHAEAIGSILKGELDGFVIPDFLSGDECKQLIEGFRNLHEQNLVRVDAGFTSHPMAFAQMDQMVRGGKISAEDYHRDAVAFRKGFQAQFGIDVEGRLIGMLDRISGGIPAGIPEDVEGHGSFIPFTFRELLPGKGTLKAHCEHLFFQEFPKFFERFSHFTKNENQLSFFIVLQKAGQGGALTLYDLIWEDGQRRPTDFDIRLPDGTQINVDDPKELPQQRISPEAGALVVFAGGKIWHRVDVVEAAPSRITLGGFLSFSPDYQRIYLWS